MNTTESQNNPPVYHGFEALTYSAPIQMCKLVQYCANVCNYDFYCPITFKIVQLSLNKYIMKEICVINN